jgi:hypothetical protein
MNFRLDHMQLTELDLRIWGEVLERFEPHSACYWYEQTLEADRRDASLMFAAQRCRSYTFPVALPPLRCPSQRGDFWIACGGALGQWRPLNISYFA